MSFSSMTLFDTSFLESATKVYIFGLLKVYILFIYISVNNLALKLHGCTKIAELNIGIT